MCTVSVSVSAAIERVAVDPKAQRGKKDSIYFYFFFFFFFFHQRIM